MQVSGSAASRRRNLEERTQTHPTRTHVLPARCHAPGVQRPTRYEVDCVAVFKITIELGVAFRAQFFSRTRINKQINKAERLT